VVQPRQPHDCSTRLLARNGRPGSPAKCPRATLLPRCGVGVWVAPQHNAYDLASQLKNIPLFISAGNGEPGPLNNSGNDPDSIEPTINAETKKFVQQLRKVGANVTVDLYGAGTHNWVYWERELHRPGPCLPTNCQRR
jgi:diacylglycerol O-acyltransferase / trehalose O-mycolyltransferase